MGWQRFFRYGQLRLIRIKGSTYSIAAGFAFGASVSFTPLPGTHVIFAAIFSVLTRGNILASLVGTLIGNPWTFPLMWWAAYKVGDFSFRLFGAKILEMPDDITWDFLVKEITESPMDLMLPWAIGGFILMMITWPIFYIFAYRMVDRLRIKHRRNAPQQRAISS